MTELEYGIVIFCDMRGFSQWSDKATVFPHLKDFMVKFYDIFYKMFPSDQGWFLKPNGDGIILVFTVKNADTDIDIKLSEFLYDKYQLLEDEYSELKTAYESKIRFPVPMQLGLGINSGPLYKIEFEDRLAGTSQVDFLSSTMNVASRLCDEARPSGVVINAHAFPKWRPSKDEPFSFHLQRRAIRGLPDECDVWVSADVFGELPREKRRSYIEFHIGTVYVNSEKCEVLLAHRSSTRELFPNKWEGGGGQIYQSESIEDGVKRLARAEFGLKIRNIVPNITSFFSIDYKGSLIPGIRVLATISDAESPVPRLSQQHDQAIWVSFDDFLDPRRWPREQFIKGAKEQISDLITRYREAYVSKDKEN